VGKKNQDEIWEIDSRETKGTIKQLVLDNFT